MRISTIFLADWAEVRDSRLQVRGGVWTALTAPQFPATHDLVLVMLLQPSQDALRLRKTGSISVRGPGGERAADATFELQLDAYAAQVPVVATVRGTFVGPGNHEVTVSLNGVPQVQTAFSVLAARGAGAGSDWAAGLRLPR